MHEHYISMSQPMVLAQLAGAKTVSRRLPTRFNSLLDGHPASKAEWDALDWSRARVDPGPSPAGNPGPYYKVPTKDADPGWRTTHRVYPRIQPGDTLLFREALDRDDQASVCHPMTAYAADGALVRSALDPAGAAMVPWSWKPRILAARFCPRWAIRLKGTVVSVTPSTPGRVTTAAEALAEGLTREAWWDSLPEDGLCAWGWRGHDKAYATPAEAYRALWEHLMGEWTPGTACWRIEWR